MPALEISDLFQRAVVWPWIGNDAYGSLAVDSPFEIGVRWVWGLTNMLNTQRESIVVDATVIVPQAILIDSLIWLGSLAGLTEIQGPPLTYTSPNLQSPDGLCQVKAIKHTPDIDNRFIRRTLGVIRYRGPLPVVPGQG